MYLDSNTISSVRLMKMLVKGSPVSLKNGKAFRGYNSCCSDKFVVVLSFDSGNMFLDR